MAVLGQYGFAIPGTSVAMGSSAVVTLPMGASWLHPGFATAPSPSLVGSCSGAGIDSQDGVAQVRALLGKLGLVEYLDKFVENGYDMISAVKAMEEADMREDCGMTAEHASVLFQELSRVGALGIEPSQPPVAAGLIQEPPPPPPPPLPTAFANFGHLAGDANLQALHLESGSELPRAFMRPLDASPQIGGATMSLGMPTMPGASQLTGLQAPGMDPMGAIPQAVVPHGATSMSVGQQHQQQNAASQAASQLYTQFYALTQLAEESAQMNAQAASFCDKPTADPLQIAMCSEAAIQAANRASWAASSIEVLESQHAEQLAGPNGVTAEWVTAMKQIAKQGAHAADGAAQSCAERAEAVGGNNIATMMAGPRKSKVPCKNNLAGHCLKGMSCEFSHDPADMQVRPLILKSMKPCMFYAKGNCMRGKACPFAHGDEERAEIEKYVGQLKKDKKTLGVGFRRQA